MLASQSLGGKHKVVLIAHGRREFLLSVSDKGTRVIGRWQNRTTEKYEKEFFDVPVGEFGTSRGRRHPGGRRPQRCRCPLRKDRACAE